MNKSEIALCYLNFERLKTKCDSCGNTDECNSLILEIRKLGIADARILRDFLTLLK